MNTNTNRILAIFAVATAVSGSFFSNAARADLEDSINCNDCMIPRVACRDAANAVDSGLALTITSGGFAGLTMATVSEISIVGTHELRRFVVTVRRDDADGNPNLVAYDADGFRLVVNGAETQGGQAPAHLDASINGQTMTNDLICREL